MPAREPSWWYAPAPTWQRALLEPVSAIYGFMSARRMQRHPGYRSRLPVVCIGNFTAGGTGKTPIAIAVASLLRRLGHTPLFLSRGYGGSLSGPVAVDPNRHAANDVGDEPLLLARHAATVVARDRAEGARAIQITAPDNGVIVMDDGFQSPAIAKDLTLVLVDEQRGIGNGRVIPSGPLRAPLTTQIARCDAVILTGRQASETTPSPFAGTDLPVLRAKTMPAAGADELTGLTVLAYAGIANPDRFFATLQGLGAKLAAARAFRDHHAFTDAEAEALLREASHLGATLVTTEKDAVRLARSGKQRDLKTASRTLAIEMHFSEDDERRLEVLFAKTIADHCPR